MNDTQHIEPAASATQTQPVSPAAKSMVEVFDRFADGVVGCYQHHYDGIEVHGVRSCAAPADDGTCYEIDNVNPSLFSVYLHLKQGGVECVGDFSHYSDAVQYGAELNAEYAWPVRNFVLDKHRNDMRATLQ